MSDRDSFASHFRRGAGARQSGSRRAGADGWLQTWAGDLRRILTAARAHGVPIASSAEGRLLEYCLHVATWIGRVGLVSRKDMPCLVTKHVAASLGVLLLDAPRPDEQWIDVGTGAGFPGMVVKLCCPRAHVTLLDSSHRKTLFLQELQDRLAIHDLDIICMRSEELAQKRAQEVAPGYQVVLMRAVGSLSETLNLVDGLAAPDCRLLTHKGPHWADELAAAATTMERLGWRFDKAIPVPWVRSTILRLLRNSRGA